MKKTIVVAVKQIDIDRGYTMSCSGCPIARAIRRSIKKSKGVRVGNSWVHVGAKAIKGSLPKRARAFIERFDSYETVKPFTFTLELA